MIYTITLNPALDREMTVPKIALDQVLRARSIRIDYGGKGINVSRALLALGTESTALGFIGGAVGDQLSAGLAELGIPTDFVRVIGETRINMSVVSEDHAHYFKVNESGPLVTDDETSALLDKVSTLAKAGDWWVLAGSSPPGVQPELAADIIHRVQAAGAYAVLDMEGVPLCVGCTSGVFMVKPNAFEAGELTGRQVITIQDAFEALPAIHKIGAQHVVISMGKAGAVFSDGKHIWWAEPPSIVERNPIGAGDAMLAGLVWGLQNNLTGDDVLRWGVACGAATASLDGTEVGSLPLVQSLLVKIRIRGSSVNDD